MPAGTDRRGYREGPHLQPSDDPQTPVPTHRRTRSHRTAPQVRSRSCPISVIKPTRRRLSERIVVLCRGSTPLADREQDLAESAPQCHSCCCGPSSSKPYCHSKERLRYRPGTAVTRHPPGSGITLKSRGDVNR